MNLSAKRFLSLSVKAVISLTRFNKFNTYSVDNRDVIVVCFFVIYVDIF